MDEDRYKITRLKENIIDLEIPEIEVRQYPVFRNGDDEDDRDFLLRVVGYADELMRRHDAHEPYSVGYRLQQDDSIRMVIRRMDTDGCIYERVLGIDEDFKKVPKN